VQRCTPISAKLELLLRISATKVGRVMDRRLGEFGGRKRGHGKRSRKDGRCIGLLTVVILELSTCFMFGYDTFTSIKPAFEEKNLLIIFQRNLKFLPNLKRSQLL